MVTFKRRDRAVCGGTRSAMFASLHEPEPVPNPDREPQLIATLHDDDTDPESDCDIDIDSAYPTASAAAAQQLVTADQVAVQSVWRTSTDGGITSNRDECTSVQIPNPLSLVNSPPSLLAEPPGSLLSERVIKNHSAPSPCACTRHSLCASAPAMSDPVDLCVPSAPTMQRRCQPSVECASAPAIHVCSSSGLSVPMPRSQVGRSRITAVKRNS